MDEKNAKLGWENDMETNKSIVGESSSLLAGDAFFRTVDRMDKFQLVGIWLITLLVLFLSFLNPDVADLKIIFGVFTLWVFIPEIALFFKNDQFVLRGKTAILIGFFAYIFTSIVLGRAEKYGINPVYVYRAAGACLLYMAVMFLVYNLMWRETQDKKFLLDRLIVELSPRILLWLLWICFLPTLFLRIFLQDWSKVSGVIEGILGIGYQPWRHTGFGDYKVIFSPIHWLYAIVPPLSGLCWIVGQKKPEARISVIAIWLFILPSLMLQRSRGYLITTVVFVLAVILLAQENKSIRYKVFIVFIILIPFLTIAANLLLIDRGTGYVASKVLAGKGGLESYELEVDPFTLVEDNLFFLSRTFKVVPSEVAYRNPFELYYFMAINPIPRFLWPNKPWMSQKYLGKIRPYYAAVTIIGDFYIYGGWFHIIIGAIVFGVILKYVDRFGKAKYPPENGRILLYAFLVLSLFYSIRALWSLVVSLYSLFTAAFLLYMIRRQMQRISAVDEKISK